MNILNKPDYAFILAAGKGTRLRPYTDTTPKPMVIVNGKPILDHTLDKLQRACVTNVTVNINYLGHVIKDYLTMRDEPKVTLSEEEELLDTGGGVLNALDTIKSEAFYVINGDALWEDPEDKSVFDMLADKWSVDHMDILLLLQPIDTSVESQSVGDYNIEADGRAVRSLDKTGTHMFTGIRISSKAIFDGVELGNFSYLELMDKAEKAGRLHGLSYEGVWHHISTAEDLERVNSILAHKDKLSA